MGIQLSIEEEQNIARQIHSAEDMAWEAIESIPQTLDILYEVPSRPERTRAGALDRLDSPIHDPCLGGSTSTKQRGRR